MSDDSTDWVREYSSTTPVFYIGYDADQLVLQVKLKVAGGIAAVAALAYALTQAWPLMFPAAG